MRVGQNFNSRRAFTILEFLAVVFVAGCILYAAVLFTFPRGNPKHPRIRCVNNLKNVGLAFRIYAMDNNERFPWELQPPLRPEPQRRSALHYYLSVRHELSTPQILHCPSDMRKPTTNWTAVTHGHISYFLNLHSTQNDPQTLLSGDRNIVIDGVTLTRKRAEIPHTAHLAWTAGQHNKQGNSAMGDGSVMQLSDARLREQWRITATNHPSQRASTFLFP